MERQDNGILKAISSMLTNSNHQLVNEYVVGFTISKMKTVCHQVTQKSYVTLSESELHTVGLATEKRPGSDICFNTGSE